MWAYKKNFDKETRYITGDADIMLFVAGLTVSCCQALNYWLLQDKTVVGSFCLVLPVDPSKLNDALQFYLPIQDNVELLSTFDFVVNQGEMEIEYQKLPSGYDIYSLESGACSVVYMKNSYYITDQCCDFYANYRDGRYYPDKLLPVETLTCKNYVGETVTLNFDYTVKGFPRLLQDVINNDEHVCTQRVFDYFLRMGMTKDAYHANEGYFAAVKKYFLDADNDAWFRKVESKEIEDFVDLSVYGVKRSDKIINQIDLAHSTDYINAYKGDGTQQLKVASEQEFVNYQQLCRDFFENGKVVWFGAKEPKTYSYLKDLPGLKTTIIDKNERMLKKISAANPGAKITPVCDNLKISSYYGKYDGLITTIIGKFSKNSSNLRDFSITCSRNVRHGGHIIVVYKKPNTIKARYLEGRKPYDLFKVGALNAFEEKGFGQRFWLEKIGKNSGTEFLVDPGEIIKAFEQAGNSRIAEGQFESNLSDCKSLARYVDLYGYLVFSQGKGNYDDDGLVEPPKQREICLGAVEKMEMEILGILGRYEKLTYIGILQLMSDNHQKYLNAWKIHDALKYLKSKGKIKCVGAGSNRYWKLSPVKKK